MGNSRVSAWFSFLLLNYQHLTDRENELVNINYRQYCNSNRCDDYKQIEGLVNKVKDILWRTSSISSDSSYKKWEDYYRLTYY